MDKNKLPQEYQPKDLMKFKLREKRELCYAIAENITGTKTGLEYWYGPHNDIMEMLETVGKSNNSVIIRFNENDTNEILYVWRKDRWILLDDPIMF